MSLFNLHKKLDKKKQKELMTKAQQFQNEYRALAEKYGVDLCAEIEVKPQGIQAVLRLRELTRPPTPDPVESKPWSEAQRDNLETRKNCQHEERPGQPDHCHKCKLPKNYWGDGMKGALQSYIDKKEAMIADLAKREAEIKDGEDQE